MIQTAVTHNGTFHPDDVFSGAVLEKVFPGIEIQRSRDKNVIDAADLVFDVGFVYDPTLYRFDHHQPGAPRRPNDIAYSAFGLLWLSFGEEYCGDKEVADAIDTRLVQVIDANDNGTQLRTLLKSGVETYEIFDVLSQFNPLFGSSETYDTQYKEAVILARTILDRLVSVEYANKAMRDYFNSQYEATDDRRYVVLELSGGFKEIAASYDDLLYFVSPDTINNTWGVTAVNTPEDKFISKQPFPEEWAGLKGEALAKVTGVPDADFCHINRFLAVAKSKEGALELLKKAMEQVNA